MTLSQLECFVETAIGGSVTVAAANLFRTPQNVSKQIQLLEQELGVLLFVRKSHGMELTEAGRDFYEVERELLSRHRTIVDQIRDRNNPDMQRLRIGVGSFSLREQQYLSDIVTKFSIKYPDLNVEYDNLPVNQLLQQLDGNELDLIIIYSSELEKRKDIRSRKIGQSAGIPGIILSKKHPAAEKEKVGFAELKDAIWGVLSRETSLDHYQRVSTTLKKENIYSENRIKDFSTRNNLQIALINQKCITLAFEDLIKGYEDQLRFYPQKIEPAPMNICLAWKNEELSTKVKNLAEFFNSGT